MILDAARLSLRNLLAPETRGVFWKSLGMTLVALLLLWLALREALALYAFPYFQNVLPSGSDWTGAALFFVSLVTGLGLAMVMALLIAPVTALIAGFFLDDVAEVIERRDYPMDAPGRAMPLMPALVGSVKFLGVVIAGNLLALVLLLVPGVNLVAFFLVNGYLLGREFFEFAATRYRSVAEARLFRRKHAPKVFVAGLVIAAFLAVPFVNLLTPLFAAGLMVHLHKRLSQSDPDFRG